MSIENRIMRTTRTVPFSPAAIYAAFHHQRCLRNGGGQRGLLILLRFLSLNQADSGGL